MHNSHVKRGGEEEEEEDLSNQIKIKDDGIDILLTFIMMKQCNAVPKKLRRLLIVMLRKPC